MMPRRASLTITDAVCTDLLTGDNYCEEFYYLRQEFFHSTFHVFACASQTDGDEIYVKCDDKW